MIILNNETVSLLVYLMLRRTTNALFEKLTIKGFTNVYNQYLQEAGCGSHCTAHAVIGWLSSLPLQVSVRDTATGAHRSLPERMEAGTAR